MKEKRSVFEEGSVGMCVRSLVTRTLDLDLVGGLDFEIVPRQAGRP